MILSSSRKKGSSLSNQPLTDCKPSRNAVGESTATGLPRRTMVKDSLPLATRPKISANSLLARTALTLVFFIAGPLRALYFFHGYSQNTSRRDSINTLANSDSPDQLKLRALRDDAAIATKSYGVEFNSACGMNETKARKSRSKRAVENSLGVLRQGSETALSLSKGRTDRV